MQRLQAPPPEPTPLSFNTLARFMTTAQVCLRVNELPQTSQQVWHRVQQIVAHNGRVLRCYPTYRGERLWLDQQQSDRVGIALWRDNPLPSGKFAAVTLLSRQLFFLLMDEVGVRACS